MQKASWIFRSCFSKKSRLWRITFENTIEQKSHLLAHQHNCLHLQNTHSCKRSYKSLYGEKPSKADYQGEPVDLGRFWPLTLTSNSLCKVVCVSPKGFLDPSYYSTKHSGDMAHLACLYMRHCGGSCVNQCRIHWCLKDTKKKKTITPPSTETKKR